MSNAQLTSLLLRGEIAEELPIDPAPGALWTWTIPNFVRVEVLFVSFTYTADANVANRYVGLEWRRAAGGIFYRTQAIVAQTAGQLRVYHGAEITPAMPVIYPNSLQIQMPVQNLLAPGYQLGVYCDGIQAGDQISASTIIYIGHGEPG